MMEDYYFDEFLEVMDAYADMHTYDPDKEVVEYVTAEEW